MTTMHKPRPRKVFHQHLNIPEPGQWEYPAWIVKVITNTSSHNTTHITPWKVLVNDTKDRPTETIDENWPYYMIVTVGRDWLKQNLTREEFAEYIADRMKK